ncbi:hypothetical protein CRE_08103 [Caenorhabditis remanei]|uniref:Uncharacterized protein n=1 Tax=Caenorhabditis remanei TaxID=31234 RepID=E3M3E7_CAERE|nr:hypothetical protein CRE_08103 [Caenorhabditis remanei]
MSAQFDDSAVIVELHQETTAEEVALKEEIHTERALRDTLDLQLIELNKNKPDLKDEEKMALIMKLYSLENENEKMKESQKEYEFEDVDELMDNLYILEAEEYKLSHTTQKEMERNQKNYDEQTKSLMELEKEEKRIIDEIMALKEDIEAAKAVCTGTLTDEEVPVLMELVKEKKHVELMKLSENRTTDSFNERLRLAEEDLEYAKIAQNDFFPPTNIPQTKEQIENEWPLNYMLCEIALEKEYRRHLKLKTMK